MRPRYKRKSKSRAVVHGYRSGLEKINQDMLDAAYVPYEFEAYRLPFIEPEKQRHYTPDFFLPNGIIVETKGRFLSKDRQKHLLVRDQHPDLEIRFVFSQASAKIYTGSKTTNAMWCKTHNLRWAEKLIPREWIEEPENGLWISALDLIKK
jgi:hypothetical protein